MVYKEVWKALKGVVANGDNYEVSSLGRIRNVNTGRVLKLYFRKKGI